jgi:hypothetical protein
MGATSRLSAMMAWQHEWDERSSFPPGPQLAVCLHGAGDDDLATLSETELLEAASAARRQTSTVPWRPGVTCHCNLAPVCRRRHRLKQTPGWKLVQPWPGVLVWVTPSGNWHITLPNRN